MISMVSTWATKWDYDTLLLSTCSCGPLSDMAACCTVEVCLKANSNANPAEIKALIERCAKTATANTQRMCLSAVSGLTCFNWLCVQMHGACQCEAYR